MMIPSREKKTPIGDRHIPRILSILIFLVAAAGCGSRQETVPSPTLVSSPSATWMPSPTAILVRTPTSTPQPIVIHAPGGTLQIVRYGFQSSFQGQEAESGSRFLILWLESTDGSYPGGEGLQADAGEVRLVGSDRSNTFLGICCLVNGGLAIGFMPPSSASTFTLIWPGNDPIRLDRPSPGE